jgi:hypothetical protein
MIAKTIPQAGIIPDKRRDEYRLSDYLKNEFGAEPLDGISFICIFLFKYPITFCRLHTLVLSFTSQAS